MFELITLQLINQAEIEDLKNWVCDAYDQMYVKIAEFSNKSQTARSKRQFATAQIYSNAIERLRGYASAVLWLEPQHKCKFDRFHYVITNNHGVQAKNF